jgi:hypothetical protein
LYRRLGGSQGRSEQMWKISPPPGFNPRTVQPIASRHTDWAIPAHILPIRNKNKITSCKSLHGCKKCCSETKHKNAVSNMNLVKQYRHLAEVTKQPKLSKVSKNNI